MKYMYYYCTPLKGYRNHIYMFCRYDYWRHHNDFQYNSLIKEHGNNHYYLTISIAYKSERITYYHLCIRDMINISEILERIL